MSIYQNILETIGNTPIVKINKINTLDCEILAKCEYFNCGGSIKDRIAIKMINEAEKENKIKPGLTTLIEPTSGNTGIGLAIVAAIRGYRMIITIPERMSIEKLDVLNALGVEIYRTNNNASHDSEESHFGLAKKLNKEIPNSFVLDQYNNHFNPEAHYESTAKELIAQCDGKIDMICCGVGTGGTITGIAKRIKETLPNCIIVGIDPVGSKVAQPSSLNCEEKSYKIEGIGHNFIPGVLNRSLIDQWVKTDDAESFLMARRLIREEGLLCGGSSGSAMVGALKAASQLKKGQRCSITSLGNSGTLMKQSVVSGDKKKRK
ncbi:hypothetical protein DICPUDRAFT_89388 [Dictyostelium purpureum]|uniref:cystathionine beta-synthase n=1 Tax=Dictyostelium purpureum TaxID=5786 RepID=F0ZVJ1_DICPU|nr:uncharacterized protein DICPUDRAFT_89388 [Dictyostelium purpureum]EGC32044.1 hypothetical protein DICPUDRAFT_89388 [Dictyostelium purpureum]|eukprot:XP_003291430.1 hypothetical protein DICPUDRAFT_89388 [Dictyostelium purpureum]